MAGVAVRRDRVVNTRRVTGHTGQTVVAARQSKERVLVRGIAPDRDRVAVLAGLREIAGYVRRCRNVFGLVTKDAV